MLENKNKMLLAGITSRLMAVVIMAIVAILLWENPDIRAKISDGFGESALVLLFILLVLTVLFMGIWAKRSTDNMPVVVFGIIVALVVLVLWNFNFDQLSLGSLLWALLSVLVIAVIAVLLFLDIVLGLAQRYRTRRNHKKSSKTMREAHPVPAVSDDTRPVPEPTQQSKAHPADDSYDDLDQGAPSSGADDCSDEDDSQNRADGYEDPRSDDPSNGTTADLPPAPADDPQTAHSDDTSTDQSWLSRFGDRFANTKFAQHFNI